jgi:hypothetical protein
MADQLTDAGSDTAPARLADAAKAASAAAGLPPVESWNPPYCGDIGMAICRDGSWTYRGSAITRLPLVKLFSTILRKDEDGRTYLVTPAEKVDVAVEDAHFLGVELDVRGAGSEQTISVRTNVDDVVTIDADHPLRFVVEDDGGGMKPYVRVRGRLDALLTRAAYAELVALAVGRRDGAEGALESGDNEPPAGVWSGGVWWPFAA